MDILDLTQKSYTNNTKLKKLWKASKKPWKAMKAPFSELILVLKLVSGWKDIWVPTELFQQLDRLKGKKPFHVFLALMVSDMDKMRAEIEALKRKQETMQETKQETAKETPESETTDCPHTENGLCVNHYPHRHL